MGKLLDGWMLWINANGVWVLIAFGSCLTLLAFSRYISLSHRRRQMGGNNEGLIQGQGVGGLTDIRFHENGGMIHFHDDQGKAKVEVPVADWHNVQRDLEANPSRREFDDKETGVKLVVESYVKDGKRDVMLKLIAPDFKSLPRSDKFTKLGQLVWS